jgi:tetraacyldisaccharide 4'-kinase
MKFKKPYFWDLPQPNFISYLLIPFTLILILRNFFFSFRKKNKLQKIKTICVGNIYVGGTGKTPLVIKIYETLTKLKKKVATVKKNHSDQKDEQLLLKKKTSLIITKSRLKAIQQGIKKNYNFLVFDDGLQETNIEFDLKIACFKSNNWIGNGQLIPAGPLREKISSLKKFDAIFLNGNLENFKNIKMQIHEVNSKIEIFRTFYKISNISNYDLNSKYLIFSGIGNPLDFKNILLENNFVIVKEMIFPDHYRYNYKDFKKIRDIARENSLKILTTEKDYMKIPEEFKKQISFLAIDLIIHNEMKFLNFLKKII